MLGHHIRILALCLALGTLCAASDLVLDGSNTWIIHTPDDGRQHMYLGHRVGNNWQWPVTFSANGDQILNQGNLHLPGGGTMLSAGRMHIFGEEHLYLLNKTGVSVSKAWGGNGNLSVEGHLTVGAGHNIYSPGRMHIHGEEHLYLLNKTGVSVSKAWGGNGNLRVDGMLRSAATVTGDLLVKASWWADHVLADGYELMPLAEVKTFVSEHGHLPGVPSEREVTTEGIKVNDMLAVHMAKIEELTLHAIAQDERLAAKDERIDELEALVRRQGALLERLEARLGKD